MRFRTRPIVCRLRGHRWSEDAESMAMIGFLKSLQGVMDTPLRECARCHRTEANYGGWTQVTIVSLPDAQSVGG